MRGAGTAGSGDAAYSEASAHVVGRLPSAGAQSRNAGSGDPAYRRVHRVWRWQKGFHDYKIRSLEGESRKWEYICLNPVRAGLTLHPEEWPFAGEIVYRENGKPVLIRGVPKLLETGVLIVGEQQPGPTATEPPTL